MITKCLLCCALLYSLAFAVCAQPAAPPEPASSVAPAEVSSAPEAPKPPGPPPRTPAAPTTFSDRLQNIIRKAQPGSALTEKTFTNNYQVRVDYLLNGKASSFTIVTAQASFTHEGLGKVEDIGGMRLPATLKFEGQLSEETGHTIFLAYFLGGSVPYPTSTSTYTAGGAKAPGSYSSIQQLSVGIKNGGLFEFGKALKVLESDGQEITITINRLKGQ